MKIQPASLAALAVLVVMVGASCSTPPEPPRQVPHSSAPSAPSAPEPAPLAKSAPAAPALTSEAAYRKQIAERIVQSSPDVFTDTLPKMLKSIVVVDITIDRDGKLTAVGIRRSNGYKALENTALNSVRRAAPFAAPPRAMRRNDGSVKFLETFLFRNDGRFQIRTLAEMQ